MSPGTSHLHNKYLLRECLEGSKIPVSLKSQLNSPAWFQAKMFSSTFVIKQERNTDLVTLLHSSSKVSTQIRENPQHPARMHMVEATHVASKPRSPNTPFRLLSCFTFCSFFGQENLIWLQAGKRVIGQCAYAFNLKFPSVTSWSLVNETLIRLAPLMSCSMVVSPSRVLFQKPSSTAESVMVKRNSIDSQLPKGINRDGFIQ